MLGAIGFLGDARQALPSVAMHRIGDLPDASDVHVALGAAIAVLDRLGRRRRSAPAHGAPRTREI